MAVRGFPTAFLSPPRCETPTGVTSHGACVQNQRRAHAEDASKPCVVGAFCLGIALGGLGAQRKSEPSCRRVVRLIAAAKKKDKGGGGDDSIYKDTVLLPDTEFSQRAQAATREPQLQEFWKSQKIYEKLQARPNPNGSFSLHDGPPYANGSLHMGHALNKILKDAINKFKAARGYKVRYIPGWDCHGLPIELKVLQSLKSKEKKGLTPLKLREIAAKFALETVEAQKKSFERYGVWGDFEEPYLTLLPKYEAAQLGIFEEMVRSGHIYRGRKPVYWSPSTRTALAEAELEYPEGHTSQSIYVAFQTSGELPDSFSKFEGLEVAVWTTTPWTMPANRAVAVNPQLEYAVVRAEWDPEDGRQARWLVVAMGLVESLQKLLGATLTVEFQFEGGLLEGIKYKHPIIHEMECAVVMGGDYITTESGTGLVHTAPGHGADDYLVGLKYGLEVAAPVDDGGKFTQEVGLESLVGANVLLDANDRVIKVLEERGQLLLRKPYKHKYPYDWRSKKPVITRATPQWFASIDGLRSKAIEAMNNVKFIPESYSNRMRPMIENRNDWCISRQRSWGVPIPVFYRKDNGDELLNSDVISHVRGIVAEKGSNAWFELSVAELLPEKYKADAELYDKGRDTMDVWFDSGSSWAYVKEILGTPVDLYLEGTDQHRGWFQSSLITSVAVNGQAPYKSVMTHGFCVDAKGRKMSKSEGNVIDPTEIIEGGKNQKTQPALGADVLRFWAASVDFTSDVSISQAILKSTEENVRRMRNRARFILGTINDFNASSDTIAYDDLPVVDRYIIHKAEAVFEQMTQDYEAYGFSSATKQLDRFMSLDLSAVYLDLAKDRLYIEGRSSHLRRSCQTVLRWLLVSLAQVISPVLSHLAEDIWQFLPGEKEASVFLSGWYSPFPGRAKQVEPAVEAFGRLLALRDPVNLAMEKARSKKVIGANLEASAKLTVKTGTELHAALETLATSTHQEADGVKCMVGVSNLEVVAVETLPALPEDEEEFFHSESEELAVQVSVRRSSEPKCERCWTRCASVGSSAAHPTLCKRCVDVVEALGMAGKPI